jgi:HEAT repeat protein
MKIFPCRLVFGSVAVLILLGVGGRAAAEDPFAALRAYRAGQAPDVPQRVENAVRAAAGTLAAGEVEQRLISILDSDAAFDAKDLACRHLRAIGTDRAVPALARLLGDVELNSIARYALEAIPGETAAGALRQALQTTAGASLIGVINSLGTRRERASLAALRPLLEHTDPATVAAALLAVGRIGSPAALEVLRAVAVHYDPSAADGGVATVVQLDSQVKAALSPATLVDAFILCAEGLERDGLEQYAAQVYSRVHDAALAPHAGRMAALQGLTRLDPPHAAAAIASHLRGSDIAARRTATGFIRLLPEAAMALLMPTLNALPPEQLAAVVPVLAARDEYALVADFLRWSEADDPQLRLAAIVALGEITGTRAAMERLLRVAAAATGAEREAARRALRRMRGAEADRALTTSAVGGEARQRAEAVRALGLRGARDATTVLLTATRDPDAGIRVAALEALAETAGPAEQPALLGCLLAAADREREAAVRALVAVSRRHPDPEARVKPLTAALADANPRAQIALIECLAQLGGPTALASVAAAAADPRGDIQMAAVAAMAGWPEASAREPLLSVVKSTPNPTLRTVALRGYLQLTGESGLNPAQLVAAYREALNLATRSEERRLVLAGVAAVPHLGALELVLDHLRDPELRNEAALAAGKIARGVADESPDRARAAAEQVLALEVSEAVKAPAREVMAHLERGEGFISAWQLAGPFTREGATDRELFDEVFPPERGGETHWRRVQANAGVVPLDQLLGGDNRVAYLRATLQSEIPRKVRFELGSDDGAKVWLNGEVIHAHNVNRGYVPGEDRFIGELRPGKNELLVKVTQGGGGWTLGVRVRSPDGARADGVRFSSE